MVFTHECILYRVNHVLTKFQPATKAAIEGHRILQLQYLNATSQNQIELHRVLSDGTKSLLKILVGDAVAWFTLRNLHRFLAQCR